MAVIIKKGRFTPGTKKYRVAARNRLANRQKMARPSKGLKLQVDRLLAGKQETKLVIAAPWNYDTNAELEQFTAFTSGITSTNEVYGLVPRILTGTEDNKRIGNQIQPVSLTVKVNLALSTAHSQSIYADVFFCRSKNISSANNSSSIAVQSLLNAGDGTNVPYDGTSYTAMLPLNKTEFIYLAHKRVKLQHALGNPNYELSSSLGASSDNTFAYTTSFSQKIKLPQRLVYEQASSQAPSNTFPFMMVGFVGTDVNGNTAPITARVYVQAQSHLYYKDA